MTSEEVTFSNHENVSKGNGTTTISSGPLFDAANEEKFEIYIYPFIFTLVYMFVGFIGNFVVIYIFTCQWKLTKTTLFILTLAFVDIFSCMFNMPIEAAILWQPLTFDHDMLCKISRYTTFAASAGSSLVLVAIAIDRYLMVCRPFKSRELDVPYAKKSCILAVFFGIVLTWPSLIFYGTYKYYIFQDDGNNVIKIESKTCLITNYYTENYTLPAAFYFFLLGGHAIIFIVLTTVYIIIGRHLFISTSTDVSDEKRHSLKFFGISMVSAITGNIPQHPETPSETGNQRSKPPSTENLHVRIDLTPPTDVENGNCDILGSGAMTPYRSGTPYPGHKILHSKVYENEALNENMSAQVNKCCEQCPLPKENHIDNKDTLSPAINGQGKKLTLKVDGLVDPRCSEFRRESARLSSDSFGSDNSQTPMTPRSPGTVRALIYRSQSEGGSKSNLNKIISDELKNSGVKEFSLKRNTLIMRVVTMAFIISFLPYLIIVTLRSSNPNIPNNLNKASQIAYHLFLRGYFINSVINPFIYGFMNEEFRLKLRSLFCKYCTSRHSN